MVGITPIRNPYLRREGEPLDAWMQRIDLVAFPAMNQNGVRGWIDSLSGQRKQAVIAELNRQMAQIHYSGTTARGMAERDPGMLKRIMRNQ
jgi:hypothetical protein